MPVWATLLALEEEGEVTTAVVVGAGDGPALVGRPRPRRVLSERDPVAAAEGLGDRRSSQDAQVCYGDVDWYERAGRLDGLLELIRGCWRARGFGDFWQYMLVAEGLAEVASDPSVKLWDLAAPMLVVQEAGGRFSDFTGARDGRRRQRARLQRRAARGGAVDRWRATTETGEPSCSATRRRCPEREGRRRPAATRSPGQAVPLATRMRPDDARRARRPGAAAGVGLRAATRDRGGAARTR